MVKFGESLKGARVREWREHYIDYSRLKSLASRCALPEPPEGYSIAPLLLSSSPGLSPRSNGTSPAPRRNPEGVFATALERELEKVAQFYAAELQALLSELERLVSKCHPVQVAGAATTPDDPLPPPTHLSVQMQPARAVWTSKLARNEVRTAFVGLYRAATKLQSFASINATAFGKIVKKFRKRRAAAAAAAATSSTAGGGDAEAADARLPEGSAVERVAAVEKSADQACQSIGQHALYRIAWRRTPP